MPPMKRMPTVMKSGHDFSRVPSVHINRSVFDRSHGYKTTLDAGLLVPVFVDEVLPGDTFTLRMHALARLTTPLKPFMDNMYLESFFFFVPYRLVWNHFAQFMGEQYAPGDSIAYTVPQVLSPTGGWPVGSVADYFGLGVVGQVNAAGVTSQSALPFRAFALIYNQWFRDENLCAPVYAGAGAGLNTPPGDGPDALTFANAPPPKRGKRHDYFTTCLPTLQKGTSVSALGGYAPVVSTVGGALGPGTGHDAPIWWGLTGGATAGTGMRAAAGANTALNLNQAGQAGEQIGWDNPKLQANLGSATLGTINDLRMAIGMQQFLERDMRGGTRYTELVYSHFRVKSDDARLQRPEYLGGGSVPVVLSPIAQTTQTGVTGGSTPLANLAGVGAAFAGGHGFSKSFTEHGVIIGLVNVRADLTYSQGQDRMWSRSTRFDFFWPVLEELGEQAVYNKEIYVQGLSSPDGQVFGYQERYAEYRYKPSKLTGLFRPNVAGQLSLWHLSELFGSLPVLGQTFIEDQTTGVLATRVAVPAEPDFYFDAFFDLKCARPMKVYGVPGLHRL